jgi:predicted transcriptional regulator
MAKRITIMLDDDLDKKIRNIQANAIQSTTSSVSFSYVINEELRKSLKKK